MDITDIGDSIKKQSKHLIKINKTYVREIGTIIGVAYILTMNISGAIPRNVVIVIESICTANNLQWQLIGDEHNTINLEIWEYLPHRR